MAKRKRETSKISPVTNGHVSKSSTTTRQTLPSTTQDSSAKPNGTTANNVSNLNGSTKSIPDYDEKPAKVLKTSTHVDISTQLPTIQIVTGSYERALHGITATAKSDAEGFSTTFADSFLFNAHQSAVKCLALSPMPEDASQGIFLATGGSDERVNVYSLSVAPMPEADSKGRKVPSMPSLGPNKISENPMNRELGTLVQHSSGITALHFPSRSKLLSASEDNTISITRVRDLETVSTVKAPRPKAAGQASGDSTSISTIPAGINDFAVHPSMKLMVSVGRGERTMRLWNLVTGKKAGVLNFDRSVLQTAKEGKHSHGEGHKIRWNKEGSEFAIVFERGIVIFGQDSQAKCVLLPTQPTKLHQIAYFTVNGSHEYVAVSTEDGKILFFDTTKFDASSKDVPILHPHALVGGRKHAISNRIKDFQILDISEHGFPGQLVVIGCSNGDVKLLTFKNTDLSQPSSEDGCIGIASKDVYSTGSRITCLVAFVMLQPLDIEGGLSEAESGFGSETGSVDSSDDE